VLERHWLSLAALTQASALAQITPGPLFATATAAGYVIGGHAGALAATVGIFAPAFLSVTVSAPIRRLIQRSVWVRAALDGIVVASVTLLGRAIVGFALPLGQWQWVVCGVATLALLASRVHATILLLGAVSAGVVAAVFHFIPS
jgi:chromate transporter